MSPEHVVSGPAAERVRPFTFERQPATTGTRTPAPGPALAAIHIEQEVERRTRELTEEIREEARRAGFEEGTATARAEMESVIDALRQAVDQAQRSSDDALDDLASSALLAGMAIAEAVVGKVVIEDPDVMLDPIRRAIHEVDGDDELVLHLHPADHRAIRQAVGGEAERPGDGASSELPALVDSVRIVDDPSIPRGSCRVESTTRIVIDGIEQRLDDIRRAVRER